MTRTVALGHVTPQMREVYSTVLQAQLTGIAATHAGMPGREIDAAARQVIVDAGYGAYFGHGYGHSLGIEIHEAPNCRPQLRGQYPGGRSLLRRAGDLSARPIRRAHRGCCRSWTEDGCMDITHSPKELIDSVRKRVAIVRAMSVKIERDIVLKKGETTHCPAVGENRRTGIRFPSGEFRNGVTFEMDGKVLQVVEFQHVKPGKGAAFRPREDAQRHHRRRDRDDLQPDRQSFPTAYH